MRAPLSTAIAIAAGGITLIGLLIPVDPLLTIRMRLVEWAVLLAGVAGLVAIVHLLSVHWRKMTARRNKNLNSAFLLIAFVITFIAGITLKPVTPDDAKDRHPYSGTHRSQSDGCAGNFVDGCRHPPVPKARRLDVGLVRHQCLRVSGHWQRIPFRHRQHPGSQRRSGGSKFPADRRSPRHPDRSRSWQSDDRFTRTARFRPAL